MRFLLVLLGLLAAGIVGSVRPVALDAASPGAQGLLAFHRYEGENGDIWVMNADGSGQK
jgi:hypothetical protein